MNIINDAVKFVEFQKKIFFNTKIIYIFIFLLINLFNYLKIKANSKIGEIENNNFDENVRSIYLEKQKNFCLNQGTFFQPDIETKIQAINVSFNNLSFNMFIYKENDIVSNSINKNGNYEGVHLIKILYSLKYYCKKKGLNSNEVTIIDIGANIGWYTFYLSKAGYELISFEASVINNYILKKNFCLNQKANITIINKALGLEEKRCYLLHPSRNIGNGIILCGKNFDRASNYNFSKEKIIFTKLSNYIPYVSKKNLALIKIDVEGSEGNVILSGIELITKFHVPFIFLEFNPDALLKKGTNPKEFLEFFEKNGYKISIIGFLSKKYSSIDNLLKFKSINLYIVYLNFLEKN